MKETLDYITDVFTASDGGIQFLKFRMFLETLEKQQDDPVQGASSRALLKIVRDFRRLIEVSQTA